MRKYTVESFDTVNELIRKNENMDGKLKMDDIAIKAGFPGAVAMYQAAKRLGLSRLFTR